jgi:predicted nucleic acid-binding protein
LFTHVLLEHEVVVGEFVLAELRTTLRKKMKVAARTVDEIEAALRDSVVVETPAEGQAADLEFLRKAL